MAKLSLGKATGNTNRRSSKRTVGLGDQQSGSAPIQFSGIEPPRLQPQASVVDTFSTPAELRAPGPVKLGAMQTEPEPTSVSDLQRLAQSLGDFDTGLKGLTTNILGQKQRETERLKLEAEQAAAGTLFGSTTNNKLRSNFRQMEQAATDENATPQQRKEAEDALIRYQAKIDNNPYFESTLNRLEVQSRAHQLSAFVSGNPTVTLANGNEIELRSLKPESSEFMQIVQQELYGDRVLTPSEARKVMPTIIQAIAGAKGTQAKQHMDYQLGEIRTQGNIVINTTIAAAQRPGSTMTSADVAEEFQEFFENIGPKGIPNLSLSKVDDLRKDFISDAVAALNNSTNRPKSFDEVLETLGTLMVGPVADRIKADGTVNDKLRYINQMDAQDLQTLRRQWNTRTSDIKTKKKNQQDLDVEQIYAKALSEVNSVIKFDSDGLPTEESLTEYEDKKAEVQAKLFSELQGQDLLRASVMSKFNTATTNIPKIWRADAQADFFTDVEMQMGKIADDPAARGVEELEAKISQAIEQRLISPTAGGSRLKQLRAMREGRYKAAQKTMRELINLRLSQYKDAGKAASSIGGSSTDKEEQLFAIRRPEMARDGMELMRELYEKGGDEALAAFPQQFSNMLAGDEGAAKYGLAASSLDPGFAQYQDLNTLQQDFNKQSDRQLQENLQQAAEGPFPIFTKKAINGIIDMAALGQSLPPHISAAVNAYGGMRTFLERELIKNEIPVDQVQNILDTQFPASGFDVELQERQQPVEEVSMIDRMLGLGVGLIGSVLPGAPANAMPSMPPAIIGTSARAQAIVSAAARVGIRPDDLAAAMSYETIGSFDPAEKNQLGYIGLIQFSPDNQRTYNVSAASTFEEQAMAAAQYLIDRGVRPGDGMERIYAAILVGNADGRGPNGEDYMNAQDVNGNSVNSAMKDLLPGGGHYQNGLRFLRGQ